MDTNGLIEMTAGSVEAALLLKLDPVTEYRKL